MGGIELAPLVTKIKVDVAGFKSDMDKVKTEAVSKANEVSKSLESTAKVGQQMSKVGGALTLGLSIPLAGAGIAAGKMAVDFESSFAKVSTLLDANIVDYGKYKNDILDASTDSKIAVDEFSEAVYSSISAGVDQTKAISFTTDAMKLAKGGFTDGAKAVDVMTTAINGYSLKTEDATKISDMLITTQNLGKTTVDELASSMGTVIPVASSVNFGMDELSASYAQLTKNGIATAESGTYLKSMLSELGKSGSITDKALRDLTGKGFADLKKEGMSTSEVLNILSGYAEKNGQTLKDMFGSVEGGSAALVLARKDGVEYNEMLNAMQKSAGATQEAFDKMDATPAEKFKGSINSLKNSAIKLGEAMIPMIVKLADMMGVFADKISALTPEQMDLIVKLGLTVIAVGPLLKITGSLISTFTKLAPAIKGVGSLFSKGIPLLGKLGTSLSGNAGLIGKMGGALAKLAPAAAPAATGLASVATSATGIGSSAAVAAGASGGLLASIGTMAIAAAPWVAGAAAVGGAAYGIYKVLDKDVIPEVDLFKDKTTVAFDKVTGVATTSTVKIADETKKQVQSYIDLSDSAQQESMNMYLGITKITDENVASITGKVSQMSSDIIKATETQKTEVIGKYKHMFDNTTALTQKEQAEIMKSINTGYDQRVSKTKSLQQELDTIYKDIAKNGENITENQQKRIDQIYEEMKVQSVEAMAESKAEQEVILNRLSASNTRITAEMGSNAIAEMNSIRDKSIKSAEEKRDALVKEAEMLKTLEGGKYAEKAEAIISSANKEYEGTKLAAEKTRKEGVNKLMTTHTELTNSIDVESGKIVSNWDKMWGNWTKFKPESKEFTIVSNHIDTYATAIRGQMDKALGWFNANGQDYVPYDGYNARLHKGERVLTKKENEEYTEGKRGKGDQTINFNGSYNFNDKADVDYFFSQAALRLKAVR